MHRGRTKTDLAFHKTNICALESADSISSCFLHSPIFKARPGNVSKALSGLASLRATSLDPKWRDGALALSLAMRACEITQYRMPQALNALAAAYAEQGEFNGAATWQEKSIGLSPEDQKSGLKDRLKLYEEKKPYREEP